MLILSANVKIVAIAAVCCLAAYAARRHGRVVLVTAVVAAGGVVLSTVVALGSGLGFGWIGVLGSSTSVYSWMAPTNKLGFLIGSVAGLFGWHVLPQAVHVATLLGAAVGAVLGGRVLLSVYRGAVEPVRCCSRSWWCAGPWCSRGTCSGRSCRWQCRPGCRNNGTG